ncbi:hypothetical protein H8356DRAFT_1352579, partial [Neocallimastix lanati (nom. inval.)]
IVCGLQKVKRCYIRNSYPLPLINDIIEKVKSAKYFTKLDLRSAYNIKKKKKKRIKENSFLNNSYATDLTSIILNVETPNLDHNLFQIVN